MTQSEKPNSVYLNPQDASAIANDPHVSFSVQAPHILPAAIAKPIDPLALRQALERMRPTLTALPRGQLIPIRLDVPNAAMSVLSHIDDIEPYRPRIASLTEVNHEWVDNIEYIAMALLEVDSQAKVAKKLPPEVMQTYREGSALRDDLRAEATVLERRGLLPRGSIDAISGDRGYRNTAVELNALGNVLRDNLPSIEGKTAITPEEIDRCNVLAQLLFRNADDRLQRAAIPADLALLRHQGYSVLILAFEEIRRCIEFLDPSAVERVAPTLFQGRGRKPGTASEEEPNKPDTQDEQPPTEEAEGALEAQIEQELTSAAAPSATTPVTGADPVQRAQALVANPNAKPSKNPFVT